MSASSWTSRGFDRLARSAGRWLRPRARLIEAVEMLRRDNEDIVKHVTATEGAIRELGIRVVLSAKPPSGGYAPAGPSRVLDQLKAPRTANSATRVVLFTPPGHESRIGSFFN